MFKPLLLDEEKITLKKRYIRHFTNKSKLFRTIIKNLTKNIQNKNKHLVIHIEIVTRSNPPVIARIFNIVNKKNKLLPQLYCRLKSIVHLLRNLNIKIRDLRKLKFKFYFFTCIHK